MIPFNIFGHSNTGGAVSEPIVWVDSSDNSSYTLSGNDVTALFNKGSLGGAMTLNGSVKFANSGFESWGNSDYISRNLGEPFLTDNSFTIATTYNLTDLATGGTTGKWFSTLYSGNVANRVQAIQFGGDTRMDAFASNLGYSNVQTENISLKTLLISYDLQTQTLISVNYNGVTQTYNNVLFNNLGDVNIYLMNAVFVTSTSTGQNNPLHEFRLYDRAVSLTEMQNLQTELNNKYTP